MYHSGHIVCTLISFSFRRAMTKAAIDLCQTRRRKLQLEIATRRRSRVLARRRSPAVFLRWREMRVAMRYLQEGSASIVIQSLRVPNDFPHSSSQTPQSAGSEISSAFKQLRSKSKSKKRKKKVRFKNAFALLRLTSSWKPAKRKGQRKGKACSERQQSCESDVFVEFLWRGGWRGAEWKVQQTKSKIFTAEVRSI